MNVREWQNSRLWLVAIALLLPSCLVNPVPTPATGGTFGADVTQLPKQDGTGASDTSGDVAMNDAAAASDVQGSDAQASDVAAAAPVTGPVAATATDGGIAAGVHLFAVAPGVLATGKLVVLLPDANRQPGEYATLAAAAASAGHRVLVLATPVAAQESCAGDGTCLELGRQEMLDGQDRTPQITVNSANCLQNRLVKALTWLDKNRPGESWGTFYNGSTPDWANIAIGGHGEGADEAAMVAKQQSVWRVMLLGGPSDSVGGQPAGWFSASSQTDASVWRALANTKDGAWSLIGASWTALGLGSSDAAVSIDDGSLPANSTQLLTTAMNVPDPHAAVAVDTALPQAAALTQHLLNAWTVLFWPY